MLFFSKKQLIPTNANLVMMSICKLIQSRLQVGQFKSVCGPLPKTLNTCRHLLINRVLHYHDRAI